MQIRLFYLLKSHLALHGALRSFTDMGIPRYSNICQKAFPLVIFFRQSMNQLSGTVLISPIRMT